MTRQKKTFTAVLSREGGDWSAYVREVPELAETSYNTRIVRTRLERQVQERYGGKVELKFEVDLPRELQDKVAMYREHDAQLRSLVDTLYNERIQISRDLLAIGMTQHEVGQILGLPQSSVAQSLSRHKTGNPLRPDTRRTSRSG